MSEKKYDFPTTFTIDLPEWAKEEISKLPECIVGEEQQMAVVNKFARLNFEHNTGGPFASGVFEVETGKVVMVAVNRVVPHLCSSAHAEVVTLSLAQQRLKTHDLGHSSLPRHSLVVNWLPCAMCFGSVVWSGIRRLVVAGDGPELEEITGFDEGPRHPEWKKQLQIRNIDFEVGVGREDAIQVFKDFAKSGNQVYNGRDGDGAKSSFD
eukprot:CAMPEP_0201536536 /NCGR_PEP_ID=MMETSP0161_2-20130828/62085_1 /ASSEMBLY_ACC=CAM_ASM_000251 /TAXON_ID=180227 /ORGANISM="Neoparamoeba aestuarina, Strain SoJaBio B1-5/56/2" /LENGTH=208 /DNA_ID=CAMNT_0047942291 /DNA_START=30 /DNA_END=656 /DNA_ORIENTATION=+